MTYTGVFGGTFNPVHFGHLRMAHEVAEVLGLDKVLFVPAGNPPLKSSELADAYQRYTMVKIAITSNNSFEVSDIEINKTGKSYTVQTLQHLLTQSNQQDNTELFFILGIDAFLDLHLWHKPEQLLALTNLVIISRPGFTFKSLLSSRYLPEISYKKMEELDQNKIQTFHTLVSSNKKAYFCKLVPLGISASQIRKFIRDGKSIKYLLPEKVESYIIKNKLYV